MMKRFGFLACVLSMLAFSSCSFGPTTHTVTLVPYQTYEQVVPLSGTTQVSDMIYSLAVRAGAQDRVIDKKTCKMKCCLIFNCLEDLERGKIVNISDQEITVHAKHYYPHDIVEEDIIVKPRTFDRINSYASKVVCTFEY